MFRFALCQETKNSPLKLSQYFQQDVGKALREIAAAEPADSVFFRHVLRDFHQIVSRVKLLEDFNSSIEELRIEIEK